MTQNLYRAVISVPADNTMLAPELNALLAEFGPFAVAPDEVTRNKILADKPAILCGFCG
ncbi:MAG: hypothetical protein ABI624_03425 [Casimicrobiaceae bacterium]